jgi:hypothetical protein
MAKRAKGLSFDQKRDKMIKIFHSSVYNGLFSRLMFLI